ncbi:MAG: hypothetical protein GXO79_16480, partial [Chlorobi bacterium]|nr:hypothetical protein [Chlorobiota bacterium]
NLKEKIIPGTMVLEALEPFPGYHHDVPTKPIPGTIYFITTEFYTRENITRVSQDVFKIVNKPFNAATGDLSIYNDKFPSIRINELTSYDYIEELQRCFQDYGIKFRKAKKIRAKGISKIKKFFCVNEIEEGVYLDTENKEMGYFKAPYLNWKLFEKITYSIKNNWEKASFDAALGTFYRKSELQDVIRIYRDNINAEILLEIREKYLKEIKKY